MKVAFYTLGCKVNLYETEVAMNKFKDKGYEIVNFDEKSDIYVINTCTVTNVSDKKSMKIIKNVVKNQPDSIIIVMGCFSQLNSEELNKIAGIDIILGNTKKAKIVELTEEFIKDRQKLNKVEEILDSLYEDMDIESLNTKTRAFVKIQDGCNNYCSYCIIPYARGNIRSKDKDLVIEEVKKLVGNGYIEVVLTGIHTGHYGKDKDYDLSDLLKELSKINNLKRIRISSIEITELDDKFLDTLKNTNIIVDHMHIPLQSGSDTILKLMNRKYDTNFFMNKINEIRKIRPNISITTDVIVGFPSETDELFEETYKFIEKIKFSKLHVFPYSIRKCTKAALMDNQIDDKTKKNRVKKLLELSINLEEEYMNKFINKTLNIIPEKYENGILTGHSDNYIQVKCKGLKTEIGKIKEVNIKSIEYPYLLD